jgi:hypothetical protein
VRETVGRILAQRLLHVFFELLFLPQFGFQVAIVFHFANDAVCSFVESAGSLQVAFVVHGTSPELQHVTRS